MDGSTTTLEARASVTAALARQLVSLRDSAPAAEAVTVAKQCLLDWLGVTLAGSREPLVTILAEELAPGDTPDGCTLIGLGRRAPLASAVLINGAAGHALDFDDVIIAMGHPTAPVAPAVLGLGEVLGSSGAQVVAAFIAGVEAECRVARLLGPSHYARGWHGTATFGSFGAAAAAGHLLGLDEASLRAAFGIAGTQAAGLKSAFGTMSKPLHAGKAAQNGVLAARLAARGFTGDTDILDAVQGFARTQSTGLDPTACLEPRSQPWVVETLFKYHAACYLTHNAIEAAGALRAEAGFTCEAIESVLVRVHPVHMGVCNIASPATGLECKLSLRMTCAMALLGADTFDEALFSDFTARRPDLVALRERISVEPTASDAGTTLEVRLAGGRTLSRTADIAVPSRDLAAQQARLERKFLGLARNAGAPPAAIERIVGLCGDLQRQPDLRGLIAAAGAAA